MCLIFRMERNFTPVQLQNMEITFHALQSRIIEMGIAMQEELEIVYEDVIKDMEDETFCGIAYTFTFYGKI